MLLRDKWSVDTWKEVMKEGLAVEPLPLAGGPTVNVIVFLLNQRVSPPITPRNKRGNPHRISFKILIGNTD